MPKQTIMALVRADPQPAPSGIGHAPAHESARTANHLEGTLELATWSRARDLYRRYAPVIRAAAREEGAAVPAFEALAEAMLEVSQLGPLARRLAVAVYQALEDEYKAISSPKKENEVKNKTEKTDMTFMTFMTG